MQRDFSVNVAKVGCFAALATTESCGRSLGGTFEDMGLCGPGLSPCNRPMLRREWSVGTRSVTFSTPE
ncbi:hypothetical protein SAMN02799622_02864 [Methylobacterium sp. UNC378MF]|nr:hypothetical protein SAMN02799622_02864 [Methylobacterium sp. UNC378MF]